MLLPWSDLFLNCPANLAMLFRPELRVVLSADCIEVFLIKRSILQGFKPEIVAHEQLDLLNPVESMEASPTLFAALESILEKYQGKPVVPVVILANLFSRYLVIPWSDAINTKPEMQAYMTHLFGQSYGDASADWHTTAHHAGYRQPALASAIHQTLLSGLESAFAKANMPLQAVYPQFMLTANKALAHMHQHRLPAHGWIVCLEPTRFTIARMEAGIWRAVHSMPMESSAAIQIEKWIVRESVIAPDTANMPVFVDSNVEVASNIKLPQYRVIDLHLPRAVSPRYPQTSLVSRAL